MKKTALAMTLILAFLFLTLFCTVHFECVHAVTEVIGIIDSDTTWTKANSPYSLTGPILVKEGVTLTIQPGVSVNLSSYYIRVAGTLRAIGSSVEKITFHNGSSNTPDWSIEFTALSTSWNEQTGSGCIIENTVIDCIHTGISARGTNPKISKSVISAFYAIDVYECSSLISDNIINGAIGIHDGNATIIGNTIRGSIFGFSINGLTEISNNTVIGNGQYANSFGISCSNAHVYDNVIYGFDKAGIVLYGNATVERNLMMNNERGLQVSSGGNSLIRYNTMTNNSVGIETNNSPVTIIYNNIQNNLQNNIFLLGGVNIDVINNWWGTTDTETIAKSIHDFRADFNLANVTFVPFLNEPNPEAPIAVTPTPSLSPLPSATPDNASPQLGPLEITIAVIVVLVIIIIILAALLLRKNDS